VKGFAQTIRVSSYGGRGLKLLKKPSYDIWTFPNSRPTFNSVKLQNVENSQIILLFILSLLLYVKLNKIFQKEKSSNLPMVFESLMLTFNLLTGYYSRQQPSARWRHFLGMECVGVKRFLRFSRRWEYGSARKLISGFRKKHLIITTHVEKLQCTRALMFSDLI